MIYMKFRTKKVFTALLLALSITAFSQSNYDAATMDSASFPKLNPNPTRLIQLKVIAPTSLSIELREQFIARSYEINKNGDFINQLDTCTFTSTGDKSTRLGQSKQRPMQLKKENTGFSGVIAIDRVATEKCHWGFQGVVSKFPSYGIVAMYLEQDTTKMFPHPPDQLIHLWCGLDPATQANPITTCASLDYFLKHPGVVASTVAKANPVTKQNIPAPFFAIDVTTKSLTIVYHDLAAENTAASAKR